MKTPSRPHSQDTAALRSIVEEQVQHELQQLSAQEGFLNVVERLRAQYPDYLDAESPDSSLDSPWVETSPSPLSAEGIAAAECEAGSWTLPPKVPGNEVLGDSLPPKLAAMGSSSSAGAIATKMCLVAAAVGAIWIGLDRLDSTYPEIEVLDSSHTAAVDDPFRDLQALEFVLIPDAAPKDAPVDPSPVPPEKPPKAPVKTSPEDELRRLERRAQKAWKNDDLAQAAQLYHQIIGLDASGQFSEPAWGDLMLLAQEGRTALDKRQIWRGYLEQFPQGRFADDARAGLCRSAPLAAKRCWSGYLKKHPDGAYRAEAQQQLSSNRDDRGATKP